MRLRPRRQARLDVDAERSAVRHILKHPLHLTGPAAYPPSPASHTVSGGSLIPFFPCGDWRLALSSTASRDHGFLMWWRREVASARPDAPPVAVLPLADFIRPSPARGIHSSNDRASNAHAILDASLRTAMVQLAATHRIYWSY